MADAADFATVLERQHLERSLAAARQPVPAGEPGECEVCGDDSQRLIEGRCAPCRDARARLLAHGGGR